MEITHAVFEHGMNIALVIASSNETWKLAMTWDLYFRDETLNCLRVLVSFSAIFIGDSAIYLQ